MKTLSRTCTRCGASGAIVRHEDGEVVVACVDSEACLGRCLSTYRPLAEAEEDFIREMKAAAGMATVVDTVRTERRACA